MLQIGVRGASATTPGNNAKQLASIIASSVLAGELSLNAALASNNLISAHMSLNRKPQPSVKPVVLQAPKGARHFQSERKTKAEEFYKSENFNIPNLTIP